MKKFEDPRIITDRENLELCTALADVGVFVDSIYQLVNTSEKYPDAIPILIEWLNRVTSLTIKEGIVRALTVRYAGKDAVGILLSEFEKYDSSIPRQELLKWVIGNAISEIGLQPDHYERVIRLIRDKEHGKAREMLVVALGTMDRDTVEYALIETLSEPKLTGYAIIALRKIKSKKAIPHIEPFLEHPAAWVRREAKKAILRLGQSS